MKPWELCGLLLPGIRFEGRRRGVDLSMFVQLPEEDLWACGWDGKEERRARLLTKAEAASSRDLLKSRLEVFLAQWPIGDGA